MKPGPRGAAVPASTRQRPRRHVPTPLGIIAAPVLGLLFVAALPLLGLITIGWGLARRHPEKPARPTGDPGPGHREPRLARREAGPCR